MRRRLEVLHMLRGLRSRIHSVREDIDLDHRPAVTGRLWRAEMEVRKAEEAVEKNWGREPSDQTMIGPENENDGPLGPSS